MMKLKETFFTAEGGSAYNTLIRRSSMGSHIVGCLAKGTTEEAIISQLRALYDVPGEAVEAAVADILTKLREADLLEE
jgi:hypothetical protein